VQPRSCRLVSNILYGCTRAAHKKILFYKRGISEKIRIIVAEKKVHLIKKNRRKKWQEKKQM
jgi:hypothetical protein